MIDSHLFDTIAESLNKLTPPGAAEIKEDFKRNIRANIQTALEKMELVTREEFDVQQALLTKMREKLAELERRVVELECKLDDSEHASNHPE